MLQAVGKAIHGLRHLADLIGSVQIQAAVEMAFFHLPDHLQGLAQGGDDATDQRHQRGDHDDQHQEKDRRQPEVGPPQLLLHGCPGRFHLAAHRSAEPGQVAGQLIGLLVDGIVHLRESVTAPPAFHQARQVGRYQPDQPIDILRDGCRQTLFLRGIGQFGHPFQAPLQNLDVMVDFPPELLVDGSRVPVDNGIHRRQSEPQLSPLHFAEETELAVANAEQFNGVVGFRVGLEGLTAQRGYPGQHQGAHGDQFAFHGPIHFLPPSWWLNPPTLPLRESNKRTNTRKDPFTEPKQNGLLERIDGRRYRKHLKKSG